MEIYNKKTNKIMKAVNFYSVEEVIIMKTDIASGEPISQIAKRLSKEFNRPYLGVEQKLYTLKRQVPVIAEWNGNKLRKARMKKVVKPLAKISDEKEIQQPAEIGIEVPHGMTFEGTPKKIMLHSDHFRIYF